MAQQKMSLYIMIGENIRRRIAAGLIKEGDKLPSCRECAVQLGGLAEVKFSGTTAPVAGWATLTADGKGGVCTAQSGQTCLVAAVDETAGTCVIKL